MLKKDLQQSFSLRSCLLLLSSTMLYVHGIHFYTSWKNGHTGANPSFHQEFYDLITPSVAA